MENEKPFDPTSLMNDADVTDRFKTVTSTTTETSGAGVDGGPLVETKLPEVDPNEEHDRLYLKMINAMNGRTEPEISLLDEYWEARNAYQQYLHKQRG